MFYKDPHGVYRARAFDRFDWLEHGFGTRTAAVPANLITLHQVHSTTTIHADARCGLIGEGDALIAASPGQVVAVKTADCLPVLLVDARRRRVAAVHSGWRGAAERIAPRTLAAMGARPEDVHAALGPAIGPCCFEVGPEVAGRFREFFPERTDLDRQTTIDLAEANRRQLIAAGVPASQIHGAELCTVCRGADFFSWRRDRQRTGRMYSWIGIRSSKPAEAPQDCK